MIWKIGFSLIVLGIILIVISILKTPSINYPTSLNLPGKTSVYQLIAYYEISADKNGMQAIGLSRWQYLIYYGFFRIMGIIPVNTVRFQVKIENLLETKGD